MKKDIFLTFAALIVAGAAAFYMLPREGGASPVTPNLGEGTILGETTPSESLAPDASPNEQAAQTVQVFLVQLLQLTDSQSEDSVVVVAARNQLSEDLQSQFALDAKGFAEDILAALNLSTLPRGFEVLQTTTQDGAAVDVSTAFQLQNGERAIRTLRVTQVGDVWLISDLHLD